jgi:hypothetical protein
MTVPIFLSFLAAVTAASSAVTSASSAVIAAPSAVIAAPSSLIDYSENGENWGENYPLCKYGE